MYALFHGIWSWIFRRILPLLAEIGTKVSTPYRAHENAYIDKFAHLHVTALQGNFVKAPLIEECLACIECKLESHFVFEAFFCFKKCFPDFSVCFLFPSPLQLPKRPLKQMQTYKIQFLYQNRVIA